MGGGSRFLTADDVVIKADKLKALERAAAAKETELVVELRDKLKAAREEIKQLKR